ncbi:M48 family metallopeptidase [Faecalicatena orotica]|uniref:M48 family metallopeptidase n=1 Tax=Faecalicatena orotica TaxID=1544 RepID=UPI003216DBD2
MKHPFKYEIIYSSRKTLAIQITPDGSVKVRAPKRCPKSTIECFLNEKESWILKHVNKAMQNPPVMKNLLSVQERNRYIKIARDIFTQKTAYYASILNVTYGRISIREQKTRWGSCSSEGNLNFNWRLIFAPEEVLDYIVVHELAHRREMNHSQAFYAIVKSILPDYKKSQKWLRDNGRSLWTVV